VIHINQIKKSSRNMNKPSIQAKINYERSISFQCRKRKRETKWNDYVLRSPASDLYFFIRCGGGDVLRGTTAADGSSEPVVANLCLPVLVMVVATAGFWELGAAAARSLEPDLKFFVAAGFGERVSSQWAARELLASQITTGAPDITRAGPWWERVQTRSGWAVVVARAAPRDRTARAALAVVVGWAARTVRKGGSTLGGVTRGGQRAGAEPT
jgi:hypothetical protein